VAKLQQSRNRQGTAEISQNIDHVKYLFDGWCAGMQLALNNHDLQQLLCCLRCLLHECIEMVIAGSVQASAVPKQHENNS
jgi:hypothetical protein